MLKLAEIENEKLAEIKLIQLAQQAMLPEFEAAADLVRNELEPFRRYDRVPFVNVSIKDELIHIRVTVQKTSAKAVSFNWLNESYSVTPSGGLFFNDGYKEQPIACDAGQIVEHFLALHKAKITARFETAMKDKRHGSDNAYIKDSEQNLGRSLAF
ncbi:hypothetical protein N9427_08720 [Paracoccaceae bacterium]|nr:hypothetical protein [Paracoccaceae bacterium]